jgi:hypothetical protein
VTGQTSCCYQRTVLCRMKKAHHASLLMWRPAHKLTQHNARQVLLHSTLQAQAKLPYHHFSIRVVPARELCAAGAVSAPVGSAH